MTTVAKINALAPWFGSKRNLAPEIVRELGPHVAYWEPFCGSMATLLAKPPSRMETVNDLHGDLINLARVIQDPRLGPALYRQVRRCWTSDGVLANAEAVVRASEPGEEPNVERARLFFVSSWMGRNGEVGLKKNERGRTLSVRWTPNGGDPATRFASAVESIPAWRRRLRNVTILRRDAFGVIGRIGDDAGTAIYCDPPYIVKSDEYLHDFPPAFFGEDAHDRLAELLQSFRRARVVVSYYDHPRLASLYPEDRWRRLRFDIAKSMSHAWRRGDNGKRAVEVLLINGPSFAEATA